jgi:hypothetical protein
MPTATLIVAVIAIIIGAAALVFTVIRSDRGWDENCTICGHPYTAHTDESTRCLAITGEFLGAPFRCQCPCYAGRIRKTTHLRRASEPADEADTRDAA